jgi:hypothetical protein
VLVAAPSLEARVLLYAQFYVSRPYEITVGWILIPWILWEVLSTWLVGGRDVAVAAHVGGFAFGAGAAAFLRSGRCRGTEWYLHSPPPRTGRAVVQRLHEARGRAGRAPRCEPRARGRPADAGGVSPLPPQGRSVTCASQSGSPGIAPSPRWST